MNKYACTLSGSICQTEVNCNFFVNGKNKMYIVVSLFIAKISERSSNEKQIFSGDSVRVFKAFLFEL